VLAGWADALHGPDSLSWVKRRLSPHAIRPDPFFGTWKTTLGEARFESAVGYEDSPPEIGDHKLSVVAGPGGIGLVGSDGRLLIGVGWPDVADVQVRSGSDGAIGHVLPLHRSGCQLGILFMTGAELWVRRDAHDPDRLGLTVNEVRTAAEPDEAGRKHSPVHGQPATERRRHMADWHAPVIVVRPQGCHPIIPLDDDHPGCEDQCGTASDGGSGRMCSVHLAPSHHRIAVPPPSGYQPGGAVLPELCRGGRRRMRR